MKNKILETTIFELGSDGQITLGPIDVPTPLIAGRGLKDSRFALSFDDNNNVVVAYGHKSIRSYSEVVVVDLSSGSVIKEERIEGFVMTGGQDSVLKNNKIFLAGQSGSHAAIAILDQNTF